MRDNEYTVEIEGYRRNTEKKVDIEGILKILEDTGG